MSHQSQNSSFNLTPSQSPVTALPCCWLLLFFSTQLMGSLKLIPNGPPWSNPVKSYENPMGSHRFDPITSGRIFWKSTGVPWGFRIRPNENHMIYPMKSHQTQWNLIKISWDPWDLPNDAYDAQQSHLNVTDLWKQTKNISQMIDF